MAQDDFQAFIERIKQAESRGQRFGKDGKLLTSPKGAQGEMQVMPATQRAPGFGVAPVRDSSPDEIARVGRDILRAFDTKYGGNRMYIAAAYNWGPGNADKWIAAGADFNKLPTETQKYLRKVAPETLTASRGRPAPATTTTTASEPAAMEPPQGISASSRGRTIAIGDSLAVGFAQANNLGGLHKGGAGPKAVLKMVQDYAANNSLEGVTVYLGTGLPNNPAQRDFVAKQVDLIKARGGNPVLFGAGPGSERTPTTGQNEFLQSIAQSTGAQFTGPLADRFPNISKQDRMGLHLTHPQYRQLFSQMGGAAPTASRPATADAAAPARPTAAASTAAAAAAAPMAAAPAARAEDLGSGYKAALALSFLGSEDKDRPTTDSELEDRLNETALAEFNKELEDYTPKNALADMELTALNPAKFMQPVKMASGGMPFVPSARVSLSARKQLEDIKNQYDRYNDEVKAYSAAADVYNAGPRTEDFTMKEPVAPTVTQEQYNKIASDAKRSAINRQTALAVASDPERFGLSINKFFADGGEVTGPTPEEIAAASRPATFSPNIARQGAAARALAAQRDVNTLPDPRTYAAVSGFFGQAPDELGFSVMHPDIQGIKRAGEVGYAAGLVPAVAPVVAPIARAVGKGATALGMKAEKALDAPVTRTLEGGGRSADMLRALGSQPSFAVKPRGGSYLSSGDISAPPISKLDQTLQFYSDAMKAEMPNTDPKIIEGFVDKKVRKYFTAAFGTGDDPVRRAIATGDIELFGETAKQVGGITPYLLKAAREGDDMAKLHLEKIYDDATQINAQMLSRASSSDADVRGALQAAKRQFEEKSGQLMTQEGVPNAYQNAPKTGIVRADEVKAYPSLYGKYQTAFDQKAQGTLPPQASYLIENQMPFYDFPVPRTELFDPFQVARSIATLPEKKLSNMSFEQALIEGTKNMKVYRDYDTAVDRAKKGLSVPKEVVGMFTKPMMSTDRGQWVRITDPEATRLEGALMHHSVGGYAIKGNNSYGQGGREGFVSGNAQVFSLRDNKTGLPQVTVESKKVGDELEITQIKGPYNSPPTFYGDDVFRMIEKNPKIKRVSSEYYTMTNTGQPLPKNIAIDWEKSFENWKANNGAGEWVLANPAYGLAELYIWGAPVTKARGGMVERTYNDNRAYL